MSLDLKVIPILKSRTIDELHSARWHQRRRAGTVMGRTPAVFPRLVMLASMALFASCTASSAMGALRHAHTAHTKRPVVVVIDPGHGGMDPGTRSPHGVMEKRLTLDIAIDVRRGLRRHQVRVVMTRTADRYVSLNQRVRVANRRGDKLFVSIHCDHSGLRHVHGFTIILPRIASKYSVAAARIVAKRLVRSGVKKYAVRHDTRNLRVLSRTRVPAILIEVGFLSNRHDALLLERPSYRRKVGRAIARGLISYLRKFHWIRRAKSRHAGPKAHKAVRRHPVPGNG
jgi:N-acetylmuramoyl-L-alanine amidase